MHKIKKKLSKLSSILIICSSLFLPTVQAATMTLEILPVPVSISVTPSTASIASGGTQQYTANAVFADDSVLDITFNELTTWTSDDDSAIIGNAEIDRGLATGIVSGVAGITATYGGVTSNIAQLTIDDGSDSGGDDGGDDPGDEAVLPGGPPPPNQLQIKIHPEKRHDPTGREISTTSTNQDIQFEVELRNPTTGEVEFISEGVTGDNGIGNIEVEGLAEGVYDVSVKTISHLRNTNKSQTLNWPSTLVDTSEGFTKLNKAGDVNMTYGDNFVNGIDFSVIANKIYTNNKKTDLNRDNVVNGIDFAITTTNIYQWGEN